jgi:hypothetical protein
MRAAWPWPPSLPVRLPQVAPVAAAHVVLDVLDEAVASRRSAGPGCLAAGRVGVQVACPRLEALVRIAETFNVSVDYLVVADAHRRPLHSAQNLLGDKLADLASRESPRRR